MSRAINKIRLLKLMLQREIKNSDAADHLEATLEHSEAYLQLQIVAAEKTIDVATKIDHELIEMCEEDDPALKEYLDGEIYERLINVMMVMIMKFKEMIKALEPVEGQIKSSNSTMATMNVVNASGISLPPITLQPFDGTYEKWPEFKNLFEAAVHNNTNFNNTLKLYHLQNLVKGEAAKVIKGGADKPKLRPENYESIWKLLADRFEHKRTLVNSYFQVLFNQNKISKETSADLKQLYDTTYEALSSLDNLGLDTNTWGDILLYLVSTKVPFHTKELWEEKLGGSDDLPEFKDFMKFIETRFRILEGIEASRLNEQSSKKSVLKKTTLHTEVQKVSFNDSKPLKCKCCLEEAHYLYKCEKFKALDPAARIKVVKNNYCYNCLGFHKTESCISSGRCLKCKGKHHTMLHIDSKAPSKLSSTPPTLNEGVPSTSDGRFSQSSTLLSKTTTEVLFPTAQVNAVNDQGFALKFRALVDACSDESYITERVVKKLQLQTETRAIETTGLGGSSTMNYERVASFTLQSLVCPSFSMKLKAYVLPRISSPRPTSQLNKAIIPQDIDLADPLFYIPGEIDMLLGGSVDATIALSGCQRFSKNNLVLKQTKLGWTASGGTAPTQCFAIAAQENANTLASLDQNMRRFWEVEEIPRKKQLTKDERLAEHIYESTTKRLSNGRYVVSLPFKGKCEEFCNMRKVAMTRYFQIERKFSKNEELYKEYSDCLNDYITLCHMSEIGPELHPNAYYIPHHCVVKNASTTTKLRVVFDASAKDANMNSLNSSLLTGPRLQDDLLDLLIRFRVHKFAFIADIQQMYRQIWINPADRRSK